MNNMIIIIIETILLVLISFYCVYLFLKDKKTQEVINYFKKPIRYGYYAMSLVSNDKLLKEKVSFKSIVYVKELDRYTNGNSKIEIDKIEYGVSESVMLHSRIDKYIRDEFESLRKTSDIEWLESEETIKETRRKKLQQLSKKFRF